MKTLGPLHSATRDLHHAVESTKFGTAMAKGTVSPEAWTMWLKAMCDIHCIIDNWAPVALQRYYPVLADYSEMLTRNMKQVPVASSIDYVQSIKTNTDALGAVYVLGGAHVMGGAIIQKQINGRLPCRHLLFDKTERPHAIQAIVQLRNREDLIDSARACFSALINTANEIESNVSVT